jgi:hypothetical protein
MNRMKYTCSITAVAIDDQALSFGFEIDEQRQRADIGITDNVVMPWLSDGLGFDAPLEKKKDSLKRFADSYIHSH